MKVLMLIISSDTPFSVYEAHKKVWLSYMNSNPAIECYFIQYWDGPQTIEKNTFWLHGKESYEGILTKTLDSLEYFLKTKYDFIIRTNLSSVWNFSPLLSYLRSLPTENVYSGFIGIHENKIRFISGSGFIMTPDVANILLQNRNIAESVKIMDDVDIGYTLSRLNIPLKQGSRNDTYLFHKDSYHYRCKSYNRQLEYDIMTNIVSYFKND